MRRGNLGFSSFFGLGAIIFVVLVGALGYTYVMSTKAEVASTVKSTSAHTIAAETTKAPEVRSTSDLSAATATLDNVSVDDLSEDDIASLEAELNNL